MNHPSIVAISAREREAESGSLYSNSVQSEHQPTPEPADYQRACSELQKMAQDMQELSAAYQRLLDLTRAVTELREPEEMFRRTLDAAVNVTGAERGFLFLLPEGAERSPGLLLNSRENLVIRRIGVHVDVAFKRQPTLASGEARQRILFGGRVGGARGHGRGEAQSAEQCRQMERGSLHGAPHQSRIHARAIL